uniref:heme oxygenase (biliverdin-producing) n=1 Tax=Poecilia mexicana TaxID=48701 RepID=A0A3B3XS55_9TELE
LTSRSLVTPGGQMDRFPNIYIFIYTYILLIIFITSRSVGISADLSEMLLAGTKESHTKTEISQLGRDFYKGIVKKDVLKKGIEALYFIYSAMEDELERNKDHPYIAPIYFPTELYRREALAQDLQYFYGVDWESLISPSPATTLWVKRIHEVGKKDPGMLVAHCYVRYIGDLSGGHLLNNVAKKVLRLPATGDGLRFYQFEGITSHKGFKQLYRSKLNEVDVEMETKLSIVDEAIRAYDYSLLVIAELEEIGKTSKEEATGFGHSHAGAMGGEGKCPFSSGNTGKRFRINLVPHTSG